jgi:endonuclease/exonuclease/phosphatase family metal-dependent hydrolase
MFNLKKIKMRLFSCLFLYVLTCVQIIYGQNAVYVSKSGSPDPDGSMLKPYHMIKSAVSKTQHSDIKRINIGPGKYYENLVISSPCTLFADRDTVIIGKFDYKSSTSLNILSLNTHLFGDLFATPKWQDYERAHDIACYLRDSTTKPDLVGFQEIWDEDLFLGGDGAEGILNASGYYPNGYHGKRKDTHIGNSGLAMMSKLILNDCQQVSWGPSFPFCTGEDCLSNKGWITVKIFKDGFTFQVFDLHAQAQEEGAESRRLQMSMLGAAISNYRKEHPGDIVFVMGDFNIFGESPEYYSTLIPYVGMIAGGKDADRNSPGFIENSFPTFTVSSSNNLAMHFNDNTKNGRLDYIFYFPSFDGSIEILPTDVKVEPFRGPNHCCVKLFFLPLEICRIDMNEFCYTIPYTSIEICQDAFCSRESSDHWSLFGQFKIIRH